MFSDLYCLIYDKIHRPQLFSSVKALTLYQSKNIIHNEISKKLLDFENDSNQSNQLDLDFDEAYYLNFYDNIFYERAIGLSLILFSALNIYVIKTYLKRFLYTKYFIFIDNTRYISNNVMSLESSMIRLFLCLFGTWSFFGVIWVGKSFVRNNLYVLPSEDILRKKYKRELLLYDNLKFSLFK